MHIIKRPRPLPIIPEKLKTIIVQKWEPLTENEIDAAFSGCETTQWWRALVQILEDSRTEYVSAATECSVANNQMLMSRWLGAHEACGDLLIVLKKKAESD